jgi:hypothetical protein
MSESRGMRAWIVRPRLYDVLSRLKGKASTSTTAPATGAPVNLSCGWFSDPLMAKGWAILMNARAHFR